MASSSWSLVLGHWSFDCGDDFLGCVGEVIRCCQLDAAFAEDFLAFFDLGAFEADDKWYLEADGFASGDDGGSDRRAAGDAAENVDQDALHVWIGEDDAEGLGDLLLVGTAADVEKVGRLAAVEFDNVHRGHRE